MVVVNKEECTGCGICTDVCPVEAISQVDGFACINADECTGCLTCVDECPAEALSES